MAINPIKIEYCIRDFHERMKVLKPLRERAFDRCQNAAHREASLEQELESAKKACKLFKNDFRQIDRELCNLEEELEFQQMQLLVKTRFSDEQVH